MDNIFYEFGRWELTKASETELEKLVKLLNDNPNITIELSAHTDMKGNDEFNQELSQKRAQSCCDYLIQHGIEKERLTPVGYGKTKPVVADKAINKQYPFIPVEQVLDEAFILKLKGDQQEICNQINRRTEFKVIKTTYKLY
jgi:peptidoglycan-associated lipoprotein